MHGQCVLLPDLTIVTALHVARVSLIDTTSAYVKIRQRGSLRNNKQARFEIEFTGLVMVPIPYRDQLLCVPLINCVYTVWLSLGRWEKSRLIGDN